MNKKSSRLVENGIYSNENELSSETFFKQISFASNDSFDELHLVTSDENSPTPMNKGSFIDFEWKHQTNYAISSDSILATGQMNKILAHHLRFNGSYHSMESMSKIINSTPYAKIKVPETKYLIKKCIQPDFKYNFHMKCKQCLRYIPSSNSETKCESCKRTVNTSSSDYFVYIPIRQQLEQIVKKEMDKILEYYSIVKEQTDMTDIHNCIAFKNAEKKYPDHVILPIIVNTDGAKVFNSGQKSLWMIQYYQCFLPPTVRFYPSNVMVVAAHFGLQKPKMKDFFLPLLKEMREITEIGGIILKHKEKQYNFMPLILGCCCDLPAKKSVQEMAGPTGHYGCGYCLHP